MSKRSAFFALLLCVFSVTTFFAAGLVQKPQLEPAPSATIPTPPPGSSPLPPVSAEIINFPLDTEGNLRVTEQSGPKEVIVTNPTLHVIVSPHLVRGHAA